MTHRPTYAPRHDAGDTKPMPVVTSQRPRRLMWFAVGAASSIFMLLVLAGIFG